MDALKGLTGLQALYLNGCDEIPAAALRELREELSGTEFDVVDGQVPLAPYAALWLTAH